MARLTTLDKKKRLSMLALAGGTLIALGGCRSNSAGYGYDIYPGADVMGQHGGDYRFGEQQGYVFKYGRITGNTYITPQYRPGDQQGRGYYSRGENGARGYHRVPPPTDYYSGDFGD